MQAHPHPGGLRDQLNPKQNNPTLIPGGLSNGDSPRCVIKPDEVACEAGGDTQTHTGFLQAPMVTDMSFHWDLAIVTTAGNFRWADGNIGTAYPNGDMVLNYSTTYHFNGWTVEGSSDGIRFTNDGTGHGMFVSIQNVFSF